jgi:hypothetical protein
VTAPNEEMPDDDRGELRRQLATIKAEVDALQIAAAGQRRSQWLQASTIVAVIAIIVPLVTWWNGEQEREFAEQQAQRVELAELTQRLSSHREAYAELWRTTARISTIGSCGSPSRLRVLSWPIERPS